jgi:hypothetical protein
LQENDVFAQDQTLLEAKTRFSMKFNYERLTTTELRWYPTVYQLTTNKSGEQLHPPHEATKVLCLHIPLQGFSFLLFRVTDSIYN